MKQVIIKFLISKLRSHDHRYWLWRGLLTPFINIKYTGCNLVMDLMDLPKEKRECVLKEKKKTWAKYFFRNKSMEVMNNIMDESDIDKETGEILYATVPPKEQNTVHYGFDLFEDAIF